MKENENKELLIVVPEELSNDELLGQEKDNIATNKLRGN